MQSVRLFNPYQNVSDVGYLRAAIDALTGLVEEVDNDLRARSGAGTADQGRLGGLHSVRVMALRRRRWAVDRVTDLTVKGVQRYPVVVDPADRVAGLSVQGQRLAPVITAGTADTEGLSSAQVWMPPGHVSHAHVHYHTDVGVVVLQGKAVTLWWDGRGCIHEVVQHAGQHLHSPFGVVHAAVNPTGQPVVAAEWRSNRIFSADNERVPELDTQVLARLAAPKAVA